MARHNESSALPVMTGAQALIASLEKSGVELVFGMPGGAILPAYDPLFSSSIRHILVRHEQAAGHAAEGYAVATGRVGVCIATSGPGATNLVTALTDANLDSVPVVAITGQVSSGFIGSDAFQEADIKGITMPITKHNFLIKDVQEIPEVIKAAFHIASTGRPGPVLVDIAKDVLESSAPFDWSDELVLPGYKPTSQPHNRQIKAAAQLIAESKRPVLYIGGGVVKARAWQELKDLVELTHIPVVTTLMARGVFPDDHRLHMGMPGMHGSVAAVGALQRADLLIAVGTRFDDRVTGRLDSFAPMAKVIHADVDPAEIGKNRHADVPVVGDAKAFFDNLKNALGHKQLPDWQTWRSYLAGLKERYPLGWTEPEDGRLSPQYVIKRLGQLAGPDAIFATGVGQHQMWASHFLPFVKPGTWLTSGGAGTMGYCIPAAMGAKAGKPDAVVWGIDGDGCFQMTCQEITTCSVNNIPIKIAVINNSVLGMVRQWQTLFYNQRYSNTDLTETLPNIPMMAESMGAVGIRVTEPDQIDDAINTAMSINDRPVVVDFRCSKDAMVWPMVSAGTSNDEIKIAREMAPEWGEEHL